LRLTWGNGEAVASLTEKIARREGFGQVLADGVKKAAERIGKGSERFAMHVAGRSLPYHDPRLSPWLGMNYMSDAQPACHMGPQGSAMLEQGLPLGLDPLLQSPKLPPYGDFDKKGSLYATGAAYFQLLSSAGLCALYAISFAVPVAELIGPVTGWDFDWNEGLTAGQRILTLRQAFNAREGIMPGAFKLPERVMSPMSMGAAAGVKIDFEALKRGYFEAMGWNTDTGKPHRETLVRLGMGKWMGNI
jgi:aldehyde:ferredoxin oxidoreductase